MKGDTQLLRDPPGISHGRVASVRPGDVHGYSDHIISSLDQQCRRYRTVYSAAQRNCYPFRHVHPLYSRRPRNTYPPGQYYFRPGTRARDKNCWHLRKWVSTSYRLRIFSALYGSYFPGDSSDARPSGPGIFIVRPILLRSGSTFLTITLTISPADTTAKGFFTNSRLISEI